MCTNSSSMRLFAEVKMRGDGVLEEMNDQVSEQDQQGRGLSAQLETLGNHLDEGRGQHESRAQRDEVAQIAALPMPLNNDRAAENIGGGGRQAQNNAGDDRVHVVSENLAAMPDVHDVSVLHNVVLAFEAERAFGARIGFRTGFE